MRFRNAACVLLLVSLATPATVLRAAGDENITTAPVQAKSIRASIERAVETVATPESSLPARQAVGFSTATGANVPLSLPRQRRVHKAGTGMMIMSVVSTAAGIAGTYYMLKVMKEQTKTTAGS